jgi:pimeloyl-ACP methyl ester carboxylesterase
MKTTIKLLAIFGLLLPLSYISWEWLSKPPQSLPQKATATTVNNDGLLPGRYYEVSIPPGKEDGYLSADYRIWIPDGVQKLRGLLVKQHGCGDTAAATGLDHANDLQWQTLAVKHQFALLGTKLPTGDKPCESWALINYGSEKAFLKALDAFAKKSHHSELKAVPWLLWGHSGGADWVIQMMQQYPDRTIAVVAARGGGFTLLGTNPTLTGIPVLFAIGEKDLEVPHETQTLPKQVFGRYRKINALWAIATEANTAHETGDTRLLAIPYFDAIATARLGQNSNDLNSIEPDRGWLADPVTHKVAPVARYEENPLEAVWLPNEETARKWQQYVTTGKIAQTRKPAMPTNVKATRNGMQEVLLTWRFTPDLENGLPSFHIYRNHSLIGTLSGQGHNFGDAADPPSVVLEFQDTNAKTNSTYTIAAFNVLGESVSQGIQPTSSISLKYFSH